MLSLRPHRLPCALAIAASCAAPAMVAARAGRPARAPIAPTDAALMPLVTQIGERVRSYHERLASISATETVIQRNLDGRFNVRGKRREFIYDLIITRLDTSPGAPADVRAERQLRLVDGRPPKKHEEPACTDPLPGYDDPLSFLLPENKARYRFDAGDAEGDELVLQFAQIEPDQTHITWKDDHCFIADGGRMVGRLWVDRAAHDVMRVESRLAEPFPVISRVPLADGGRFLLIERSDTTVRLARVRFENPDEILLLPESIETITSVRGAATPRMQTEQTFTSYRRFMTEAKIKGGQ